MRTPEAFIASAARIQNEESARQLIGLFFTAMETGDEVALRYAALAASHAADCIVAVTDALSLKATVSIALSGSIMTAVAPPAYRRMIEYELFRRKGKFYTLRVNDRLPVDGAVRWVRQRNQVITQINEIKKPFAFSRTVCLLFACFFVLRFVLAHREREMRHVDAIIVLDECPANRHPVSDGNIHGGYVVVADDGKHLVYMQRFKRIVFAGACGLNRVALLPVLALE